MCMGFPMQVVSLSPGHAQVSGRGQTQTVSTALVGEPELGEWLLVFMDNARERISPQRAAEVNAALDLVAQAMGALAGSTDWNDVALADPGFALPSALSAAELAALAGQAQS